MAEQENPATQQLHIRLPKGLHAELVKRADAHAVHVNTVIKLLLADAVGWSAKPERKKERI